MIYINSSRERKRGIRDIGAETEEAARELLGSYGEVR